MAMLKGSLTTPLPRELAFEYIADWSRQAEWDPNTVTSTRIGDGESEVGARYALEVKMGPRVLPMEYRITEREAPSRLVLIGEGSGVWTEDVITFTEVESGTHVDYQAELKLTGLLRYAEPFLGRAYDGITKGAIEGMQRELDARAQT